MVGFPEGGQIANLLAIPKHLNPVMERESRLSHRLRKLTVLHERR